MSLLQFRECSSYILDEILVVFHPSSASLYILDELSAWLFLSLDAGLSKFEIKQELIDNQSNIDEESLEYAFDEVYKLTHPNIQNITYRHEYEDLIKSSSTYSASFPLVVTITLLGKTFHIYSNDMTFTTYLKKLLIGDCFSNIEVDYHVEIFFKKNDYELRCNGLHVANIAKHEFILPILMDHLQILAYQSFDYLLAIHSAMLEVNGKGLMLPGQSGSGKSTLSASLLSQGYNCYSDEIAVISALDNKLMPLPLPIAIKSGSWDVIQNDFPNIDSLFTWSRSDGRCSKYIKLPHRNNNLDSIPVNCIIFPHYQSDKSSSELVSLNSVSTLKQLILSGYQIRDNLSQEKVEQILTWITKIPAYNLTYSNTNEAQKIINNLIT